MVYDRGTTEGDTVMSTLHHQDPEIAALIEGEHRRQADTLRLIPSENYCSSAVMEATGSVLTNKYSEGYPGKRYYEGQECIDPVETLAIERLKALYGVDHVNVQPYSGSPANLAVYFGVLQPGDTVMGMSLPHGGHLTHGWNVSITGKYFNAVQYPVDRDTGLLNMDTIRELALEHKPKMIIAGTTAYPRVVDFPAFASIAKEVGAVLLADMAHISGLVAGGSHPSPVGHADIITSTTHKTLRGPRGGMILCNEEYARTVDRAVFPGLQGGPHNHTTAALAVAAKEASTDAGNVKNNNNTGTGSSTTTTADSSDIPKSPQLTVTRMVQSTDSSAAVQALVNNNSHLEENTSPKKAAAEKALKESAELPPPPPPKKTEKRKENKTKGKERKKN